MATPKKDPSEHKKGGRPKQSYDNGDLRNHLIGIKYMKELSFAAQNIIRNATKEFKDKGNSDRAYDSATILALVSGVSKVTTESVKEFIERSDKFEQSEYGKTSVNNYKQVLVTVATRLSELKSKKGFIRKDQKDSETYMEDNESLSVISLVEEGGSLDELERLIAKIRKNHTIKAA